MAMDMKAKSKGFTHVHPDDHLTIEKEARRDESFAGRTLKSFTSISSTFDRCDFRSMRIESASFGGGTEDSFYRECVFDGSWINARTLGCAVFERCSFRDVVFEELFSMNGEFVDCVFTGEIRSGWFNGTVPKPANPAIRFARMRNRIEGNDFSGCNLGDVDFRTGVDLTRQILPVNDQSFLISDIPAAIELINAALPTISDPATRKAVTISVEGLQDYVKSGQRQQFMTKAGFSKYTIAAFPVLHEICTSNLLA